MNYQPTPEGRDPRLWQIARRRAGFKRHLATYIIINIFLWMIWFFTSSRTDQNGIPWPAWASLGWGIGLAYNYMGAYMTNPDNSVEKEYDKLTQQQNKI